MKIKTLQWNIGGGKIRKENDDPMDSSAYCNDNLNSFIEVIKNSGADVITVQESHTNDACIQAEKISNALGFEYFTNDAYNKSHLEDGQMLSQSIISRFPITDHKFELFLNPKFETIGPNGEHWISHDKGVSSCLIEIDENRKLQMKTSHSFPFYWFSADCYLEKTLDLRNDMENKIKSSGEYFLYQGDLNLDMDSVTEAIPNVLSGGVQEIILGEPTTPKGRKCDHVLFKGIKHISSRIMTNVLSDHYPIVSEFEI